MNTIHTDELYKTGEHNPFLDLLSDSGVPVTELDGHSSAEVAPYDVSEAIDEFRGANPEAASVLETMDKRRLSQRELKNTVYNYYEEEPPISVREFLNRHRSLEQTTTTIEFLENGMHPESVANNDRIIYEVLARSSEESDDPAMTRQLLFDLLSCDGIELDQPDSELVDEMVINPEDISTRVGMVASAWRESEGGVSDGVRSKVLLGTFNRYGRQNHSSNEISYEQSQRESLGHHIAALDYVDDTVIEACQKSGMDIEGREMSGFIDNVAYKMHKGKEITAHDVRFAAADFMDACRGTPPEIEALLKPNKITGHQSGNQIKGYEDFAPFAASIREVDEFYESLSAIYEDDTDSLERAVQSAFAGLLEHHEREERDPSSDGSPTAALRSAVELYLREPRYDKEIYEELMTFTYADQAERAGQRLSDPEFLGVLDDPELSDDAKKRLPEIMLHREHAIATAAEAFKSIDCDLPNLMKIMLWSEPRKSELVPEYYRALVEAMSRKDKNGTPYDSPETVERFVLLEHTASEKYKDNIKWFKTGTVPLALCETVIAARRIIAPDAGEMSPDEVYEIYRNNPEYIAQISTENLQNYLEGELRAPGLHCQGKYKGDSEAALQFAREEAEKRQESFRVFVNLDADTLVKVDHGFGAVKSIMDTDVVDPSEVEIGGMPRTTEYILHRNELELMVGNRSHDESDHPIYGSCGYIDSGIPSGAQGYGDVMLSYKVDDDLSERVTFTPEDSFNGTFRLGAEDAQALRILKNGADQGHLTTGDYVEAQIQGGVELSAVDKIYVKTNAEYNRLRKVLSPELASKVELNPGEYDSSKEQSQFSVFREKPAPQVARAEVTPTTFEPVSATAWHEYEDDIVF